jgi:hypothetical protein
MTLWILAPVAASAFALAATPAPSATDLALAMQHTSGPTSAVSLRCQPPQGTHPNPSGACQTLSTVDGNFDRLPHEQLMCTQIWDPVAVTATGQWQGNPVRFTHSYDNPCLAGAETGGVFDF